MNKNFLLALLLLGCSSKTEIATVMAEDGHTVLTLINSATEIECSSTGSRVDFYVDMNNDLQVNTNDRYLNSYVSCNGSNGMNGADGQPGPQGVQGLVGPQGVKGDTGEVGPQGAPGVAGPMGPQGPQGLQGTSGQNGSSAIITLYNSNQCTNIIGTNKYVKVGNNNVQIYSASSCSSNSKIAEVSQGESYWVSSTSLAVYDFNSIKVITFQ